jgi:hypothetical protein
MISQIQKWGHFVKQLLWTRRDCSEQNRAAKHDHGAHLRSSTGTCNVLRDFLERRELQCDCIPLLARDCFVVGWRLFLILL